MTDIVIRLRNRATKADMIHATLPLDMMAVPVEEVNEAATMIETLRARIQKGNEWMAENEVEHRAEIETLRVMIGRFVNHHELYCECQGTGYDLIQDAERLT